MLAMNYRGPQRVRIDHKPMPEILHPEDAIVRVTRSCICGSDLHLYNGSVPDTRVVMTFGHEITGVVEQIGSAVEKLKVGDHVLVPFNIACGKCVFCQQELYGNCHESNSQATAVGGIFGYSHTAGGYNGGQAEYVRVPYADVSPTVIPEGMDLDDAVLLTDVVPTGYQAAEMGGIQPGDTVVVFGAGPVGIMAARCAWLFGAGRVIVIDCVDYRLEFARKYAPCEAYDFRSLKDSVVFIKHATESLGADVCIDAVGAEAAGSALQTVFGRKLLIKGWGVDADPKNDPTYPMKLRNDGEQAGYSWERPPRQQPTVEVLHSNERADLTSVFGTSVPPSGPSGALRRLAFRYSESSYGHWLPLVLADRLSVVGGVLGDLKQGRVPNVLAERGWKAEWEHNRSDLFRRIVLRAVIVSAIVAYFSSRGGNPH